MDLRNAPMLLPAAAFAAGTLTAFHLTSISVPLLAGLVGLGVALSHRRGALLACFAAGLLAAAVRLDLPERIGERLDRDRPIEAVARIAGHWSRDEEGWAAPARVVRLRQALAVESVPFEVLLHVPGEEAPPEYGSLVRLKGYLRRSAGFANRLPVPAGPWRLRLKSRAFLAVEEAPGGVARLSAALRRRAEAAYAAAGPASGGSRRGKALARALVLGDAAELPLEWKRGLRLSGLSHALSVSGLHVGMVAGLVLLLSRRLPGRLRLGLVLAAVGLYLLLVGPLPALVRSSVMALLAAAALFLERPPAAANALGWAVLLLLLDRPELVNAPAFQLTVAATAGLLLVAPPLARRWRLLPGWLAAGLAVSAGAQLATLPWTLPLFSTVSLAAPLANLAAVPWIALALAASLLWTAVAWAAPQLAAAMLPALDLIAAPFGWPAGVRPEIWLAVPIAAPPAAAWLLAAAVGLGLFLPLRARLWRWAVLGLAAALCQGAAPAEQRPRGLEMVVLDVGQGDSILLRDGRRAALIDGGGWERGDLGGRVLLPALAAEGVRRLDALVMTHPDRDHCQGLVDVASYVPVEEVWSGPGWDPTGCAGRFHALPGTRRRVLWAGERLAVGRWRLFVLHPEAGERRGTNDRSLVLLAAGHGRRVLLTGDIEEWAEQRLVSRAGSGLEVDVLKVAHHGSKTSTTATFLDAASPRLALISAGPNNPYYHPSSVVLERLRARRIPTLRTDLAGMIHLEIEEDGTLHVTTPGAPR